MVHGGGLFTTLAKEKTVARKIVPLF